MTTAASDKRDGGLARSIRTRTCVGCGKPFPKGDLHRIARLPEGAVVFDAGGKAPGRGAYVCSPECLATAVRKRKLDRALRTTLASDQIATIADSVAASARDARK